jgi:high-affinity iron transporter
MTFSFLVTAREGLEMALIVTILLGYLRSVDQKQHFRAIWLGVGAAAGISVAFAAVLEIASRELDGRVLEAFEGFTMLFAVAVLTWMLFWMRSQSAGISRDLRAKMDMALSAGSVTALALLAFSSVGREGLETALFLFAGSANQGSDVSFLLGGLLGFGVAAAAGLVIYYGFATLPLRHFFSISAVVLMVLAAGLLTNALTELHEATVIPDLGVRPWDTEATLPMSSDLGKFLHTVLGYDSAPAISQIALYWSYITLAGMAYFAMPLIVQDRRPARVITPEPSQATPS